jgi:signal transduction histidine kinase
VEAWSQIRYDPAALLLVVREASRTLTSAAFSFFPSILGDPAILGGAVSFLERESRRPDGDTLPNSELRIIPAVGSIDWTRGSNERVYRSCLAYARTAQRVAESTGHCDPENAWVAGFLAPLGWLAVAAADPDQVAACLADPHWADDPDSIERKYWGWDQDAISRRLVRRWQLPRWLSLLLGHLGLNAQFAHELGADPALFRIVQFAAGLVHKCGQGLFLKLGTTVADNAAELRVSAGEQERWELEIMTPAPAPARCNEGLAIEPITLLREILIVAGENHKLRGSPIQEELEFERDRLQDALEKQQSAETERLRAQKLRSLAEFSAGAAHEINNPLAVISGQAQYLISHEMDPARQRSLQTIITQTQRIHQVLTDLMQFARPNRPQRQLVNVHNLIHEVVLSLGDLATHKEIRLICAEPEATIHLTVDPRQLRTALECLLRNAIEAAPARGWASIRVTSSSADRLEFVVEDNGIGPSPSQCEHLFDPFYSGRQAGRGRGLGLPTAWRLARENGGDVRWDENSGGPTRFTLSLPREVEEHVAIPEICVAEASPAAIRL